MEAEMFQRLDLPTTTICGYAQPALRWFVDSGQVSVSAATTNNAAARASSPNHHLYKICQNTLREQCF